MPVALLQLSAGLGLCPEESNQFGRSSMEADERAASTRAIGFGEEIAFIYWFSIHWVTALMATTRGAGPGRSQEFHPGLPHAVIICYPGYASAGSGVGSRSGIPS